MPRYPLALLLFLALSLGCTASRKGVVGPELFRFKQVFGAQGSQTVERFLASANVAGQAFYAFTLSEGSTTEMHWVVEVEPGSRSGLFTRPEPILPVDDTLAIEAKQLGNRWIVLAVRSGTTLYYGYITILPTTQPQYIVGELTPVTLPGQSREIPEFQLIAHPNATTAWIAWTEYLPATDTAAAESTLRVTQIDSLITGTPVATQRYDSGPIPLDGAAGSLALSDTTTWDGHLLGSYLTGNSQPMLILGQQDAASPAAAPVLEGTLGALAGGNFYNAPRQTTERFTAPPNVEPCPGTDGFFHTDSWPSTARNEGHVALTRAVERKFNCPDDPEQSLFEGTQWLLGGVNDRLKAFEATRPLLVVEGGARQRAFTWHPSEDKNVVAYSNDAIVRLGVVGIDFGTVPEGMSFDALTGVGTNEFNSIRLVGHTATGIFIADRRVGEL